MTKILFKIEIVFIIVIGWSETQTITFEDENSTKTPTEEPTESEEPTIPTDETTHDEPTISNDSNQTEQLIIILGIVATSVGSAALVTGLLVYFKIRKRKV